MVEIEREIKIKQPDELEGSEYGDQHGAPVRCYGWAGAKESETSVSFAILLRAASTASVSKKTIINFHELCRSYQDLRNFVKAPEMPSPSDINGGGHSQ